MGFGRNMDALRASPASTVWHKLRLPVAALVVATCAATIIALAFDARQRFFHIQFDLSETVEHELTELESELARLTTMLAGPAPATQLAGLRQSMDGIGMRMRRLDATFAAAEILRTQPYAEGLAELNRRSGRLLATATLQDAALTAELTPLLTETRDMLDALSTLAEQARADHQVQIAANRAVIGAALLRLVVLTVVLVLVLSVVSVQLMRLYLRSREQADAARRTGARLETIFRTSADAILVTDWTGRVLDCNRATLAIFGHPRERLFGADAMDLLFPQDARDEQRLRVTQALQTSDPRIDGPLRLELEAIHADGSRFPVEVSLAPARVEGGDIIVALMRDISARRRAERELTEARDRALAGEQAKADFLAVMSHEMRTPLNGLVGSIELLAQTPLDRRQRELVTVLGASAEILLDHVNSVLDIARSEARPADAEFIDFDFERLLEDCLANQASIAASGGNVLEQRPLSGRIGALRSEPARLRQVMLNLLGNAVKFTRNGHIIVETQIIEDWLEIRVIDSGIGIAPENHQRIFEDFVTLDSGYDRRSGGTGLGLGIARRLARIMGGDITVTSAPGSGSRFTLRLPFRPGTAPAAALAPDAADSLPAAAPLTVLLIEDNDINRFIAQSFLESAGHEVVATRSGLEGLAEADRRTFDVVLTDISMPGLDGLQVARRIRDGGGPSAGSRILALTAHSLAAEPEALSRAGIDVCLQKPIGRAALLRALVTAPEPTAPPPPSAIDTDQMRELRSQIGGPALAALIRQMILDGDAVMSRLRALGSEPPPDAARRLAHQMAGAIATFGSGPLHQRLTRLLDALRQGAPAGADLAALPDLWQATRTALADEARALRQAEAHAPDGADHHPAMGAQG